MKNSIFREVSLERLSSPEQLDQMMSVTSPRAWFALIGISAILLTAILWGIFGSIPYKTNGEGILIKSEGVYNITHTKGGKIIDISIEAGDTVRKGDIIARIEQSELVEQIVDLEKQLKQIKNFNIDMFDGYTEKPSPALSQLYELARSIREAKSAVEINRAEYNGVRLQLEQAKLNVTTQEQDVGRLAVLLEHGAIARVEFEAASANLEQSKLQAKALEASIAELNTGESAALHSAKLEQAQLTVKLLEEQLSEAKQINEIQLEEQILKLKRELEFGSNIVATEDGRVLEVKMRKGGLIQPGMELIGVEREGKTIRDIEVELYVPAEDGKQISPGMEAQISPTIVKKEEYGFMLGRVISVSEFPATSQGMMTTLGSQELVSRLSKGSAPIEVRIELITDSNTISGYKWSSPNGPPITIDSGTLCDGTITVSSQPPIRMVIPKVRKFVMGY
ncbi:MAG: hypothetical protein VR72_02660 [Clostridiaceae bacterium BRH_c20a]|nr:MAG: hypothetical protein VR72_02660 [Clostridiaceae bacterium BRH_c20a]